GFERGEIVRGSEMLPFDLLRDGRPRNVPDVTFSPLELLDLGGVDVKTGGRESLSREQEREGQPDIAQSDDAHLGGLVFELALEKCRRLGARRDVLFDPHGISPAILTGCLSAEFVPRDPGTRRSHHSNQNTATGPHPRLAKK